MQPLRRSVIAPVAAAAATVATTLLLPASARAAAPSPGNLLIYRTGDGTAEQASNATSVWIDEYTTAGTLVQSISIPATGASALTVGATTTTEGALSVSLDNNWAVFTGYRADVGTTGLTTSPVPRVIGRLNLASGAIDTDTALGLSYTNPDGADGAQGSSIRGIAATDGTHFWTVGTSKNNNENGGTVYTVGNGPTAVSTVVVNRNQRGVGIYGGELYENNSGTTFRKISSLAAEDTGAPGYPALPTISGVADPSILGGQVNVNGFIMFDLSTEIAGPDTLYFPSTNTGVSTLQKFSFDGFVWNPSGAAAVSDVPSANASLYNITGKQNTDGSIVLYMTDTGTDGGSPAKAVPSVLVSVTDTTGFNGMLDGSSTLIATSADNTTFRGLAIVPTPAVVAIPGDVNHDGIVDLGDINYVTARWLNNGSDGDADGNGIIDLGDINYITARWLNTSEPGGIAAGALAAVPEPTSLGLLGIVAAGLVRRRRRHA